MNKLFLALPFIVMAMIVPVHADEGITGTINTLTDDLDLSDAQVEKMAVIVDRFREKQSQVPMPGQVLLDNKSTLREVLTSKEFDQQKAEALIGKVTAIIQTATLNRLELRHDLYQVLTPDQQEQYLGMVQGRVAELLQ